MQVVECVTGIFNNVLLQTILLHFGLDDHYSVVSAPLFLRSRHWVLHYYYWYGMLREDSDAADPTATVKARNTEHAMVICARLGISTRPPRPRRSLAAWAEVSQRSLPPSRSSVSSIRPAAAPPSLQ